VARYFGLNEATGAIVSEVTRNSPGERAGFRVGDIIIRANGEKVTDDAGLMSLLEDSKAGDTVNMTVLRERKQMDLHLKLEKR
jgi:serine protease Do